jgi:hypothetical protein
MFSEPGFGQSSMKRHSCFSTTFLNQQHPPDASLHPHVGSPPEIMLLMIAAAHPTPAFTLMAPNSQFNAQAPHSMQRSRSTTAAFLPLISKTPRGQTSTHLPHPAHASAL